jgi:hypothetical protein
MQQRLHSVPCWRYRVLSYHGYFPTYISALGCPPRTAIRSSWPQTCSWTASTALWLYDWKASWKVYKRYVTLWTSPTTQVVNLSRGHVIWPICMRRAWWYNPPMGSPQCQSRSNDSERLSLNLFRCCLTICHRPGHMWIKSENYTGSLQTITPPCLFRDWPVGCYYIRQLIDLVIFKFVHIRCKFSEFPKFRSSISPWTTSSLDCHQ